MKKEENCKIVFLKRFVLKYVSEIPKFNLKKSQIFQEKNLTNLTAKFSTNLRQKFAKKHKIGTKKNLVN
jgi:hypothetical protein